MLTFGSAGIPGLDVQTRLDTYGKLLVKWQAKINLVGRSTVLDLWTRHFDDSLQLLPLAGDWRNWVDLGSGGGFPGMVIAIAAGGGDRTVHLIESDKRKAAFLGAVSRETQTKVEIHAERIEVALSSLNSQIEIDVVSARALASLGVLVGYARPILEKGAVGLFLKGKDLQTELTEVNANGSLNLTLVKSRTDPNGRIVVVRANSCRSKSV